MHQIALPAQQVAVEALHDGHDGDDHGADDDGGVDKAQQAHESRIGVTIGAVPSPDGPAKEHRRCQQGQIHSAVGAGGGLELIFQ